VVYSVAKKTVTDLKKKKKKLYC